MEELEGEQYAGADLSASLMTTLKDFLADQRRKNASRLTELTEQIAAADETVAQADSVVSALAHSEIHSNDKKRKAAEKAAEKSRKHALTVKKKAVAELGKLEQGLRCIRRQKGEEFASLLDDMRDKARALPVIIKS